MISFDNFAMEDGSPIYLQLIRHVKQGIIAGTICHQDEAPSRRVLSALLGVNPNTVQKAYRILEDEGILESRTGAKSFITLTPTQLVQIRRELTASDTAALVSAMQQMGLTLDETLDLIKTHWGEKST